MNWDLLEWLLGGCTIILALLLILCFLDIGGII